MKPLRSCCLFALLAACNAAPLPVDSVDALVGTWQFEGAVPAGARIPTLSVGRDGRLSGTAGVNKFQGSLELASLSHGGFRAGQFAVTQMAGTAEAMQLEASFLQALAAADSAQQSGRRLVLCKNGRVLLELSRVSGR